MALLVDAPVDGGLSRSAGISLNVGGRAETVGDESAQRIGIIGGVGDDVADAFQACQQCLGLRTIAPLSGCRMDADWQANGIDRCMQLGCQTTAGPADRLNLAPPLWMARP